MSLASFSDVKVMNANSQLGWSARLLIKVTGDFQSLQHPWAKTQTANERQEVHRLGVLCLWIRDMHSATCADHFRFEHATPSPAAADSDSQEQGAAGPWPGGVLERPTICATTYLSTSADIIGSLGSLLLRGDVLYSTFALARASLERTTTIMWLLSPALSTRERASRAWLDQYNAYDHSVGSTRDATARAEFKRNRKKLKKDLSVWFNEPEEFVLDSADSTGSVRAITVCGSSYPTFAERFDGTGLQMGWADFGKVYDTLSGFAHPNVELERVLETGGQRRIDVLGIERLIRLVLAGHLAAQSHLRGYMGWPDHPFELYEKKLEELSPGLFTN